MRTPTHQQHGIALALSSICFISVSILHAQQVIPKAAPLAFEPNIPIVRITAEKPIASDVKTPCSVQFLCPKGEESCPPTNLAGVVRYHGASSQAYPKKSF